MCQLSEAKKSCQFHSFLSKKTSDSSSSIIKPFVVSEGGFCPLAVGPLGPRCGQDLGQVRSPPEFTRGLKVSLGQVALHLFIPHPVKWGTGVSS